jgi:hypothetical protein
MHSHKENERCHFLVIHKLTQGSHRSPFGQCLTYIESCKVIVSTARWNKCNGELLLLGQNV